MRSIWRENTDAVRFDTLKGKAHTDVLIIGGGITGLLCAHFLKKAGVDCLLVTQGRICDGVTQNTTAKITFAHGLLYDKLTERFDTHRARLYLEAQREACREYARLCASIPCDYEEKDSYVYSLYDRAKIEREIRALRRLGAEAEFSDAPLLPIRVAGAVRVKAQAQFHPLKFAFSIAKELPVYENTKVLELSPQKAITEQGEITCQRMIIATHFPILSKHGGYFLKMYQHRSYVIALEGAEDVEGMYVDESDTGLSFRNYGGLLLLGGGGHRTGKQGGAWRETEAFARMYYKGARVVGKWATQDTMTLDGVPYIGRYAKSTPNLYVATGFNKWGMSSAMVAARLLCDLLCGRENPYAAVFSPCRSILRPQLAINAWETIVSLLTPTVPRCPHLGCALKYNKEEHSWDCPCHGSRFTKDGRLLDNPATGDKRNMPK